MNTDDLGTTLRAAVNALYRTFARYPLRAQVVGCPHCVSAADHARIHGRSLRELTVTDLEQYGWKAMTTWGDVDDFRHFLPRLLELTAYERFPYGPEPVVGKLVYARWRTWPVVEQQAIETYFLVLWQVVLAGFPSDATAPSFADADVYLTSVDVAVDDLTPFLVSWPLDSLPALLHLARFLSLSVASSASEDKHGLPNLFGNARRAQNAQVLQWLAHANALERMERAFFDHSTALYAHDLAVAADYLWWLSLAPNPTQQGTS